MMLGIADDHIYWEVYDVYIGLEWGHSWSSRSVYAE